MKKIRIYPLERSPFYRLSNKSKLANLLKIKPRDLSKLRGDRLYNTFPKNTGSKLRDIQAPIGLRDRVHAQIQKLISRIETPEHLFSGKKGLSPLDNAKHHLQNHYFLSTDIENFFPSCKREYIFRFFHYQIKMSEDIAWLMTDIICYDDHVPTGSHLSQSVAYWAYSNTFDQIDKLAREQDLKFSLYVDDMTFSGAAPIPRNLHLSIGYKLKRVGLKLKRRKTRYYSKKQFKKVTGATISPTNELLITNRHRKKLKEIKDRYDDMTEMSPKTVRSFLGTLRYTRQIQSDYYQQLYFILKPIEQELNRSLASQSKLR